MPSVAHIIRRRHSRKRLRYDESKRSKFWLIVTLGIPLTIALTPFLGVTALSLWLYGVAASHMPMPEDTVFIDPVAGVTRFFDSTGSVPIYTVDDPLGDERSWLALEDLTQDLINATLLVEDPDFFSAGASLGPVHTLMQLWQYVIGLPLEVERGITGEMVRETILPRANSSGLDETLLEIVLSAESRRLYSADELLEWHLNSSYYGRDAYGINAAAWIYLGKPAYVLSLAEAALLAPIVTQTSLNPFEDEVSARERGADLLFKMLDAALIGQTQFDSASAAFIDIRKAEMQHSDIAPAFVDYARRQAEQILNSQGFDGAQLVARGSLRITTSLDMDLQHQAECVMRTYLARLNDASDELSTLDESACEAAANLPTPAARPSTPPDIGALTLIDVDSGSILSMFGDATGQSRQPAIVLQPFVYMDAFLRREYTPASMVYDLPQSYPGRAADLIYTPANPDGRYRGPLNLRDAMAAGLLPPAVQVASAQGVKPVMQTAQALGFNGLASIGYDLDILERGGAVSVMDTAYAYSVLASMGAMRGAAVEPLAEGFRGRDPVAILRIEDAEGRVLWSYNEYARQANEAYLFEPSLAYMVNDILADDAARQSALQQPDPALSISRPTAVLDGLSADKRDSWTVGYTPDLVLAVHAGRADESPLDLEAYDRVGSAPVWRNLIEYAHRHLELPPRDWQAPPDVEEFLVCDISGLLPATTDHCPTRREIVPAGSQLRRDDLWQTFEINRTTGQLATVNTPVNLRESLAYFVPPEDIVGWWVENGKPMPPSSYSTDTEQEGNRPVRLTSPADYAYVGATVDIAGSNSRVGAETWLLEYGSEVNPARWFTIGERRTVDESGAIAATWQTALLSGIHTLRLTVTFTDGTIETDSKLLTFDNTPPSVKLRTGDSASEIQYPAQKVVSLLAEVSDNLTIERVEFYRNEELLGEDRDWPYGYEYPLDSLGEIVFRALAFDQVGNRAASELVVSIVEG